MKSQSATRLGIDNTPPSFIIEKLRLTAEHILEPVRAEFKKPFSPSSWYRCSELNAAIGGSPKSQHQKGEAVDFEVPSVPNYTLAKWIQDNLVFDQLILEFYTPGVPNSGWVHCSFVGTRKNRKSVLTAVKSRGKTIYLSGLRR